MKHQPPLLCLILLAGLHMSLHAQYMPWDNNYDFPAKTSPLNMSRMNDCAIDENGFIFIKDGHFHNKEGRINFFGVNVTHACFSSKERSVQMADQLAGMGMNMVRVHFIDFVDVWGTFQKINEPSFNYDDFDANKLDLLDFFLAELKKRGIYVYLDLHSGWHYRNDGAIKMKEYQQRGLIQNGKGVDTFVPELINQLKWYCKKLLNHTNSYTGLKYKDDPLFAMMEINNENAFYRQLFTYRKINKLPPPIRKALEARWAEFIRTRYGSVDRINKEWKTQYAALNEIALPPDLKEFTRNPKGYREAFAKFMYEIDDGYFGDMYDYVKKEIGIRVPLTSSQVDYSYPSAMSKNSDFIDIHNYWCYPKVQMVHGKPWEQGNVVFDNYSMVPYTNGMYNKINSYRVKGKPLVVSEINIPAANDYGAEASIIPPILSKIQDHDAIIFYAYQMQVEYRTSVIQNFMNTFSKKALFPIASTLFRGNTLAPHAHSVLYKIGLDDEIAQGMIQQVMPHPLYTKKWGMVDQDFTTIPAKVMRNARVYMEYKAGKSEVPKVDLSALPRDKNLTWVSNKKKIKDSYFHYENDYYNVFVGFTPMVGKCTFKHSMISQAKSENDHVIYTLFNKNGKLGEKGTYIVTFQGKRIYEGYQYFHRGKDVTKVPDRHGMKLVTKSTARLKKEQIQLLNGALKIRFNHKPSNEDIKISAIDNAGKRNASVQIPFTLNDGELQCELRPEYKTIVYIIDVN